MNCLSQLRSPILEFYVHPLVDSSISLPPDFGSGHVICYGQWDISGLNKNPGSKCISMIEVTSCALSSLYKKDVSQGSHWLKEVKRHVEQTHLKLGALGPSLDQSVNLQMYEKEIYNNGTRLLSFGVVCYTALW